MIAESALHDVDAYFQERLRDNRRFWTRLGGRPPLRGRTVLDFGCGHGALAIEMAEAGAARVVAIDCSAERIAYCRDKVLPGAPQGVLELRRGDIADMDESASFDLIVSRDTMEHVWPLEPVLAAMARLLRPGGSLYLGFSPLYCSPFGDHGELRTPLPWAHLLAGEARVLAAFNRTNHSDFRSLVEAGFNMLTPRQFRARFDALGFVTAHLRINPAEQWSKRIVMGVFDVLRRVPALERFFTVGVYIVLRKPG
ncbi:MAG: class I SAM-dependent methyltransferase [Alphaproteobacteria bacterium]|nr:class I SAM-dependent methyltransferase [Alphaproteobacteria bacterium]